MRVLLRIVMLVFIVVGATALYSFFADNGPIELMARRAACAGEGPKCHPFLARAARSPLAQDYAFRIGGGATVDVHCARAYVLVGEMSCARVDRAASRR